MWTSRRTVWGQVLTVLLMEASSIAFAQPAGTPPPYAFNGGFYNAVKIQEAVAAGRARVMAPGDSTVKYRVQHQRFEVLERDPSATAQLVTVYVLCETAWNQNWDGSGRMYEGLKEVVYRYVLINAYGLPTGAKLVRYKSDPGSNGWRKESQELSVADFYKDVPQLFRDSLHTVSGFLVNNPGQPIVPFLPTADQQAAELMTKALLLAVPLAIPREIAKVINEKTPTELKMTLSWASNSFGEVLVDEAKKQADRGQLKFGWNEGLDSSRVTDANRDRFRTAGRPLWPADLSIPPPSAPTPLRIIR